MTFYDWTIGWIKWLAGEDASLEKRLTSLEQRVNAMADALDDIKADFEDYQTKVNATLTALNTKINGMVTGLDPAKAAAVDAEIKAAIAVLATP